MTQQQRLQVIQDRKVMSAIEVARKHGISRARVYQLVASDPGAWKVVKTEGRPLRKPSDTVSFPSRKLKHLNSRGLQNRILRSSESDAKLAKTLGLSEYAVARVRHLRGPLPTPGGGQRALDGAYLTTGAVHVR